MWFDRLLPCLPILALSSLVGCTELRYDDKLSLGTMGGAVGVATQKLRVEVARTTFSYDVAIKGCSGWCTHGFEPLEIRSSSCSEGCEVTSLGLNDRGLNFAELTAERPGKYTLQVEAVGSDTGDTLSADFEVEFLDPSQVDLILRFQLDADYIDRYTHLIPGQRVAFQATRMVERSSSENPRTVAYDDAELQWEAIGGTIEEANSETRALAIVHTEGEQITVTGSFGGVTAQISAEVIEPSQAVRTVLWVNGTEILDDAAEPPSANRYFSLATAFEGEQSQRFVGGADQLSVTGEGCFLSAYTGDATARRELELQKNARCELLVTDPGGERRSVWLENPVESGSDPVAPID